MKQANRLQRKLAVVALLSVLTATAFWVLLSGTAAGPEFAAAAQTGERRATGYPQLVSVEPLPAMDGEMCEWMPASASANLVAALRQERSSARAASGSAPDAVVIDRAPLRTIRDPNPAFSAIAIEPESGMLVVTDENLFQVLEYDRKDNTPPTARMTEPKRVIGGALTKAEMMCGVYIDPKTLDTYIINNDTQDWLVVFSKEAQGNVAPNRELAVPHGTFGIAVDESRAEMYLTVQHSNAVVVYRKGASGQEPPLRRLFGDATQLEDPHGIVLDTKNNLLFVSNHGSVSYRGQEDGPRDVRGASTDEAEERAMRGFVRGTGKFDPPSITVYSHDAKGNTKPLRIIEGPRTQLNWPAQIALDEERGELYVANDMDHSVLVFRASDQGNVAPIRVIRGAQSGIRNPTGVALDLNNKELWVANMGNHSATVYPVTANGDVAPLRTIRGGPVDEPALMIGNPGGVGYDTKREEILVPN